MKYIFHVHGQEDSICTTKNPVLPNLTYRLNTIPLKISANYFVDINELILIFMCAKLLQSCLTLCDPKARSPPGSSVHGILKARILEWVAMPSSRGSSQPRDRTHVSYVSCTGRQVLYHQYTFTIYMERQKTQNRQHNIEQQSQRTDTT